MSKFWRWLRAAITPAPRTPRRSRPLGVEPLEDRCLLSYGVAPNVTYHGGLLLANVQVKNVFYGQSWPNDANLQQTVTQSDNFLKYFVSSPYFDVLKQYNVNSGSLLNTDDYVNQNPINQTIDDSQIRQVLDGEVTAGHVAAPGPNSLYIFYTTPGVVVTAGGQNSTNDFAGYHDVFTDSGGAAVYYAVIPYPSGGVGAGLSAFQQETIVLSHETAEAVTDPDTQTGWFDARYGEIGDIANGQYGLLSSYVVSGVWSQSAGQVVIPGPTTASGLQVSGVPVTAVAGQPFTNIVATITNAPTTATASTYKTTIDWGNGTTSTGTLSVDPNGGFDVIGTNTYAQSGTDSITVTVNDTTNTFLGATLTKAKVTSAAATIQPTGTLFTATVGQSFSGTVATFTDSRPGAVVGNYTASINWGDGTTSAGTVATGTTGFVITGSHTYATSLSGWFANPANNSVVSVTITDTTTSTSATALSLATIPPAPVVIAAQGVNIAAVGGKVFTGVVATFTTTIAGAVAADFTATINWGNGATATGTVQVNPAGGFEVVGTNTYTTTNDWWGFDHGGRNFLISVSITDNKTQDQTKTTSSAKVASTAPNLAVAAQNVAATVGQSFTGIVAIFRDANAALTAANFTATINWGDGTATSAGTISVDPNGGFDVIGTHTYATASTAQSLWGLGGFFHHGGFGPGSGKFPLSVTVTSTTNTDAGTSDASATVTPALANVQATGILFSAVFGTSFTGTVATFTTPLSVTGWTVTINWGDGQTSTGSIVATTGGYTVTGTHTYGNPGFGGFFHAKGNDSGPQPFLVSVTINDTTHNTTATVVSLAGLTAKPPVIVASGVNLNLLVNTAFTGTVAAFTDSDLAGTASFTATIYWGDGASSTGTVTANPSAAGYLVGGSHTYSKTGSFFVVVRIQDADGNTAVGQGRATDSGSSLLVTLAGACTGFLNSGEYDYKLVVKDYQQYLGRTPASSEVNAWVYQVQHGLTQNQMHAAFLSSGEFYAAAGNNSAGWVTALYKDVLGRTPNAGDVNAWLKCMTAGASLNAVALAFITSGEHESALIQNYYQQYLNRTASASEVGAWLTQYHLGATNDQIITAFLGSQEYFQKHSANTSDWLASAYVNLLSRTAAPVEINAWLAYLGLL